MPNTLLRVFPIMRTILYGFVTLLYTTISLAAPMLSSLQIEQARYNQLNVTDKLKEYCDGKSHCQFFWHDMIFATSETQETFRLFYRYHVEYRCLYPDGTVEHHAKPLQRLTNGWKLKFSKHLICTKNYTYGPRHFMEYNREVFIGIQSLCLMERQNQGEI